MLHGELRATKAPKDRVHLSVFSMTSLPWSVSHGQNNALMSRPFAVPIPRALIFIKRPGHSRNPVLLDVVLQHLIPAWSILAALALCLHIVHLHWFFSKFFSKPTHFYSQKNVFPGFISLSTLPTFKFLMFKSTILWSPSHCSFHFL